MVGLRINCISTLYSAASIGTGKIVVHKILTAQIHGTWRLVDVAFYEIRYTPPDSFWFGSVVMDIPDVINPASTTCLL